MGTLAVTIDSVAVAVHEPTGVNIDDRAQQPTQASFAVYDDTGLTLQQKQQVTISDSVDGDLYAGYIDTFETTIYQPTSSKLWAIRCTDGHWLANKRVYTGPEMNGRMAGDIAGSLHQGYLAAEGITATYAIDHDYDASTWGTGTHSGTTGANGDLELAKSGSIYTKTETSNADWNTGTRTRCYVGNNILYPEQYSAVLMTGEVSASESANTFSYVKIWSGSLTLNANDYLEYNLWISSTSPEINGGVDLICSDGYWMKDSPALDQYQIPVSPKTNLQGYANDQWFYRKIIMPSQMVGKTLSAATLALEGDKDGTYNMYVHSVYLKASNGTTRATIFNGNLTTNQQLANAGYKNVALIPTVAYADNAIRVSPAYSIAGVGNIGDSLISWTAWEPVKDELPLQTGGQGTYAQSVIIEASLDGGASWQECTNHAPLPNLTPGANSTGRTVTLRQILNIGGPNPIYPPWLYDITFTVQPGYAAAAKTDVLHGDTAGNMGDGTLSAVINGASGLYLDGYYRDWDDADLTSQTEWGGPAGNSAQSCYYRSLQLRADPSYDARSQFSFAGQHTNFTVEMDVKIVHASAAYGLVYRTTYWGDGNNTFAYAVQISDTGVVLGRGTNNSSGGWTGIVTANHTFTVGDWYRMRVVVSGNTHQVYIDDVLYINTTDSTFGGAGYFGARYYNATAARNSGFYDNFGLQDNDTGYRTAPSVSISACGTVLNSFIDWEADVPGNSSLDIQVSTNGGSTYTSCTRGSTIPGCEPGVNVSGKSLLVKAIFTANNSNVTPLLKGIGWRVLGGYSATGTRTSVATAVGGVGRAGSTSMAWVADIPTGGGVTVQTSTNGSTWNTVAASGDPIAGLTSQPDPTDEDFNVDHSANFTSTFYAGGAVATYTWGTALSRLTIANGTNAVYAWNSVSAKDKVIEAILYQSNNGGLIARYTDVSNHYRMVIYDDASSVTGSRNKIIVTRRVAGVDTQIGSPATIDFHRGTYHKVTFSLIGQVLTVLWDGVQVFTNTDSAGISASGKTGFFNTGGTAYYQSIRCQPQGQDLTGLSVYHKITLTSTDPLVTPRIFDATIAVRSPDILSGVEIPSTSMRYKKIPAILSDIAKRSNYWWEIRSKKLLFMNRVGTLAPWPLSSVPYADGTNDIQALAVPKVVGTSPMYRNRQYITNAYDVVDIVESKHGDGITQSWALTGKVISVSSVKVNNQKRDYGIDQIDTGREYYWTPLEVTFNQDKAYTPLADGEVLTITYKGLVPYEAMAESTAQQTIIAGYDGSTGIVEESEDGGGCDKATADQLAQARITQYAILSRDFTFSTMRKGLKPGQLLSVFISEYGLNDVDFFIVGVKTTIKLRSDGTTLTYYEVTGTEGPPLGSWTRMFALN